MRSLSIKLMFVGICVVSAWVGSATAETLFQHECLMTFCTGQVGDCILDSGEHFHLCYDADERQCYMIVGGTQVCTGETALGTGCQRIFTKCNP